MKNEGIVPGGIAVATGPVGLRVNGLASPMGLGTPRPEFSWKLVGDAPQRAYELIVEQMGGGKPRVVWDSGMVAATEPFGVFYSGEALESAMRYLWRVRTWGDEAEPGPWSEDATFAVGILNPSEWLAHWVASPSVNSVTAAYFRGSGVVEEGREVASAVAFVSSLGWHRFFLNGADLTGEALVPRWTPFDDEVEYIAYDVTDAIQQGANAIGVAVGAGRFAGSLGIENHRRVYGNQLGTLVQIHIRFADGGSQLIVSGEQWEVGSGQISASDPKTGERVDLRLDADFWIPKPGDGYEPATILASDRHLIAESVERVTCIDRLAPVAITRVGSDTQIVDFGQNFAGVVRIRLPGGSGRKVTLTFSELLDRKGGLDLDYIHPFPWGRWYQRDSVVLGSKPEEWSTWFTIHGFRYVEVSGLGRDLRDADISALVLSTDVAYTGRFECSDRRLNQLWSNVEWSMKSNFMDTSTDCPTRERSGWTGDIQVFAPTSALYADTQPFLRRFLHNLALEQHADGTIPVVIPSGFSSFSGGPRGQLAQAGTAAGWSDAACFLPWTVYEYFGDPTVLSDQYASMVAWVENCRARARDHTAKNRRKLRASNPEVERYIVGTGFQFGEWLRPGENAIASAIDGQKRGAVVATAYFERSARILSWASDVLGYAAEAKEYRDLADKVRWAWRQAFVQDDGVIGTDRQDDYVRAIAFDLVEGKERRRAVARLVHLIKKADIHLDTGFLSTPMLLRVLVDEGHGSLAWELLLQTSDPSWLHQVEMGATTVWETWSGHNRRGKPALSHNHFSFGSVARFLVEGIVGIRPRSPGYASVSISPLIGGGLTHASATVATPYGDVSASWRIEGDVVQADVIVPPGASAVFCPIGHGDGSTLESGAHSLTFPVAVKGGSRS